MPTLLVDIADLPLSSDPTHPISKIRGASSLGQHQARCRGIMDSEKVSSGNSCALAKSRA
jgi:hypothetical protein